MNREQLSDAIGRLDEHLVAEALHQRRRRPWWYTAIAVAACFCIAAGSLVAYTFFRPVGIDSAVEAPAVTTTTGEKKSTTTTAKESTATTAPVTSSTIKSTPSTTTKIKKPQSTVVKPLVSTLGLLAAPQYPRMVQRPAVSEDHYWYDGDTEAWSNSVKKQRNQLDGQTDGMGDFYSQTITAFLDGKAGENRLYSPVNVYLALSVLAETTQGESRRQLLRLLDVDGISALREKSSALWNGLYMDDGAVLCRLANSLWLAKGQRYNSTTVSRLANKYYASVYEGKMGSKSYNAQLQDWLNQQTDGLLKQQAGQLGFTKDTALALASTICFRARWHTVFSETEKGTFYTADGKKKCEFLHRERDWDYAKFGKNFTSISLDLDDGAYKMKFFQPNEGVSVEELLKDDQVLQVMQGEEERVETKFMEINMDIPKFDVVSDRDLSSGLKALGVTDVFNANKSDFGGIFDKQSQPVTLGKVDHAVRVAIDEEGVTATAYTVAFVAGSPQPEGVLDFKLDKPFVFAITGPDDTILFAGVIENP